MSIISGANAVVGSSGAYQISRSLRFNSADSAYLNRTPASAGNRKTFTLSFWAKRSKIGGATPYYVFQAGSGTAEGTWFGIVFEPDVFTFGTWTTTGGSTTAVYRDVSAWYHIVLAVDTTQATAANRAKIYVNNVQQATTTVTITQNADLAWNNASVVHYIGARVDSGPRHFYDGYLADIYNIDGQALTPSSFGEFNTDTGVWQPKAYTGSYGTNGFYLDFADNSGTTSTTLGKDSSGNGNNWTPNNFSVTAGAGNDSLVDSPTRYGTDTGAGGEVRGNYCTWNPLSTGRTVSNGNLDYAGAASGITKGTVAVSSGKWYWEITAGNINSSAGVASVTLSPTTTYCGQTADSWCYFSSGNRFNNNASTSGYSSFTTNDIIGVALDMDNGKIYWSKNGTWQGSSDPAAGTNAAYTNLSGTITPANGNNTVNDSGTANFGQRPFAYTAPSGFKALVTTNLPAPTIADGGEYFDAVAYSGTGATQTITVDFASDFAWLKRRDGTGENVLLDILRLTGSLPNRLFSNSTSAESTAADGQNSFSSTGIVLDGSGSGGEVNFSGRTYVAWQWKANGAGVSNTAGTITSTVSVNTTSGFSIVTYTGTGSAATIGHGLGAVPRMIIVKNRDAADAWQVYHAANTAAPETDYLVLNTDAATADAADRWNDTLPTSTVFSIGNGVEVNTNTEDYVAYCFAPVAGYSAFGSYTGNGSADGPFVYTGFRPKYVLIKMSSSTGDWYVFDTGRDPYNATTFGLVPNNSDADTSYTGWGDLLSNGFKIRRTDAAWNTNGGTYIYAAFAENPFSIALAR